MKFPVGVKIRIDYKRVFLISEFLISGIHCTGKSEKKSAKTTLDTNCKNWQEKENETQHRKNSQKKPNFQQKNVAQNFYGKNSFFGKESAFLKTFLDVNVSSLWSWRNRLSDVSSKYFILFKNRNSCCFHRIYPQWDWPDLLKLYITLSLIIISDHLKINAIVQIWKWSTCQNLGCFSLRWHRSSSLIRCHVKTVPSLLASKPKIWSRGSS